MRMHLRPSSCGSATATPRTPPTGAVSRPHRPLLRLQPLPAGERWGYPSTGDSYPLAAFHRNDPDNGFTLCFEDRDGQQGLHRFYDTQAEQEKRCQHLTLHLRLEPCDIERLFQIQRLAPCIASTFLFRIGGEEVRCTLRRIEGYDPSAASTRCTFTRLPNG